MRISKIMLFAAIAVFGFSFHSASAATMFVTTDSATVAAGSTFDVNVRIDSGDQTVNAAQGVIKFPKDVLEAVQVGRSNSIFNIWIQEPAINAATGEIEFLGGSTNSFGGKSLQVLTITFRARGTGKATIDFSNAAVTAGDGTGANILSESKSFDVTVAAKGAAPAAPAQVAPPVQITRPAIKAAAVPAAPVVNIPLYPDPEKWYSATSQFFANWQLPPDITAIATAVNKIPDFTPSQSEGLFQSKQFQELSEGIWYLHVRFRNNVGWGETAHIRIGIDVTPPSAFSVSTDSTSTMNTQPVISFGSGDALSGIDRYEITVDRGNSIATASTTYMLPFQTPGDHIVRVRAVDKAGNATESSLKFSVEWIERYILSIGGIGITPTVFSIFLVVIIAVIFAVGIIVGRRRAFMMGAKATIAQRDIFAISKIISGEADKAMRVAGSQAMSASDIENIKNSTRIIKENAEKLVKYAVEEVEDIPK